MVDAPGRNTPVQGRVLHRGRAVGQALVLTHPLSFWGGVDAIGGVVSDPRHPQHGASIKDRVLVLPATVGSSSSSAIMLELLRHGTAPAAILLGHVDAILPLGVVVAAELGHATIPVLEVPLALLNAIPDGATVRVELDGSVAVG
jgi:predicted aconitase with swiveling domain